MSVPETKPSSAHAPQGVGGVPAEGIIGADGQAGAQGKEDEETWAPAPIQQFGPREIELLEEEDTEAARHIGQMLTGFFLYSLCIMAVVMWLTWQFWDH